MTKQITKAIILQEIQDKFKLREFDTAPFLFDETVVPVYDISHHVENMKTQTSTLSITSTGSTVFYTVPQNERWYLRRYDVILMTGAFTVAGMYSQRKTYPGTFIYLDLKAAQNVSYHVDLLVPILFVPGDQIQVNVDGFTSTGNLQVNIDYMVEEVR